MSLNNLSPFGAVVCACLLISGGCSTGSPGLSYAPSARTQLGSYPLRGDTHPIHDPSIIRQAASFYSFTSDLQTPDAGKVLPIRCSREGIGWSACGSVFQRVPAWLLTRVPDLGSLWAPDVSFFDGAYHVYYAASTSGSQRSVIALATNPTLDAADPAYHWVDRGPVIESQPGDDFNAIDPNILVDADGTVWLTYGSYWSGIKQVQLDPETGLRRAGSPRYDLATRPGVPDNPIEGASVVRHGRYYYLFASMDYCCGALADSNYKQAVGRGPSAHGPFLDQAGTPMLRGGGTVLLEGNGTWNAPGGGTVFIDPQTHDSMIVFHALDMRQNGAVNLWVKRIDWSSGWPELLPAPAVNAAIR